MERDFKKTKNTRKKANNFLKTRLMERDLKSPEEDLTGEKTITASLQQLVSKYEVKVISRRRFCVLEIVLCQTIQPGGLWVGGNLLFAR